MERWRIVEGFENYAISDKGNVKNLRFGRIIQPFPDKNGYMIVNLYGNGKMKTLKVHRLVMIAFVSNPERKEQVNHINGNKKDNRLINLEWATQSENQNHRRKVLGKDGGGLKRKKILCIDTGKTYVSIMEAERKTGTYHQHIGDCLRGERKKAGGMRWRLVE